MTKPELQHTLESVAGIIAFALAHDAILEVAALLMDRFQATGTMTERDIMEALIRRNRETRLTDPETEGDYVSVTNADSSYRHEP